MGCGVWAAMTPGLVARTPDFSTDVETFRNEIKIEKEEGRIPNFGIMILFFGASHFFIFFIMAARRNHTRTRILAWPR